MFIRQKLIVPLALVLYTASASAGTIVYAITGNQQFGTVNLSSGAFTQIGPNTPEGNEGLTPAPNGSLLTLTYSGNLDSINPATGVTTVIGATGLADCTTPASPCGPTAANTLGGLAGKIYATDFSNDLYAVNPSTGAATLIGPTGIPAVPAIPGSTNPDGSLNISFESLFGAGGNLYATFDAITVNASFTAITAVISGNLYRINPSSGAAALIGPTAETLLGDVEVNGTVYAFDNWDGQVVTLDLANGNTSVVSSLGSSGFNEIICGAAPTPEPASIALAGIGVAVLLVSKRRRRQS